MISQGPVLAPEGRRNKAPGEALRTRGRGRRVSPAPLAPEGRRNKAPGEALRTRGAAAGLALKGAGLARPSTSVAGETLGTMSGLRAGSRIDRATFRVSSKVDSRTILDGNGAGTDRRHRCSSWMWTNSRTVSSTGPIACFCNRFRLVRLSGPRAGDDVERGGGPDDVSGAFRDLPAGSSGLPVEFHPGLHGEREARLRVSGSAGTVARSGSSRPTSPTNSSASWLCSPGKLSAAIRVQATPSTLSPSAASAAASPATSARLSGERRHSSAIASGAPLLATTTSSPAPSFHAWLTASH